VFRVENCNGTSGIASVVERNSRSGKENMEDEDKKTTDGEDEKADDECTDEDSDCASCSGCCSSCGK